MLLLSEETDSLQYMLLYGGNHALQQVRQTLLFTKEMKKAFNT